MRLSIRNGAVLGGMLGWWLGGCSEPPPAPALIRPVRAMKVADATGLSNRTWPGRAKATQEVNLSFRVSGPLISLPVKVGDRVKEGDVVAQIDPRDFEVRVRNLEGQLATAQANLKAMKAGARPEEIEQFKAAVQRAEAAVKRWEFELDRIMKLEGSAAAAPVEKRRTMEEKTAAEAALKEAQEALRIGQAGARPEDVEAKEAEIRSLEASVEAARNELDYTHLRAPFDGEIAAKYVENFETVQAKQLVVRLLDSSSIEMVVDIPEDKISLVPYVKEVSCVFDAFGDRQIPARIKEIGTEASTTTRTYPVTLIMKQPEDIRILPGMAGVARGRADLPEQAGRGGWEVPASAVLSADDGRRFVWSINEADMTVHKLEVTPGDLTSRGIVVAGVQPGQWIATAGVHSLAEGQKVRILQDEPKGVMQ